MYLLNTYRHLLVVQFYRCRSLPLLNCLGSIFLIQEMWVQRHAFSCPRLLNSIITILSFYLTYEPCLLSALLFHSDFLQLALSWLVFLVGYSKQDKALQNWLVSRVRIYFFFFFLIISWSFSFSVSYCICYFLVYNFGITLHFCFFLWYKFSS